MNPPLAEPAWKSWSLIALGLVVAAGLFHAIGSIALDRYLVAQAGSEWRWMAAGQSLIRFDFDNTHDLVGEKIDGAPTLAVEGGILRARLSEGRGNAGLNLRGRFLDASRFDFFSARIQSSAAGELVLIFDEPGQLVENLVSVPLDAGWNDLALPLAELPWRRKREIDAQLAITDEPWGGESLAIGEFRLYFALPPGSEIALDEVRFSERELATGALRSHQPLKRIEWIDAAEAQRRLGLLQPLRAEAEQRIGILLPSWYWTADRALALRDAARARDAETLFWPAHRALPASLDELPADGLSAWRPPLWLAAGHALILMLGFWWLRKRHDRLSAGLELFLLWAPPVLLLAGLTVSESPSPALWSLLLLPLLYSLGRCDWRTLWRHSWSRVAWDRMFLLSLPLLAGLVIVGLSLGGPNEPGSQRWWSYPIFVLLQQAVLLGVLLPLCQRLSPRFGIFLAAAIFALLHAPNSSLMLLAGLGALLWCQLHRQGVGLLPIVVSHVLLGMAAVSLLPPWLLYSANLSLMWLMPA